MRTKSDEIEKSRISSQQPSYSKEAAMAKKEDQKKKPVTSDDRFKSVHNDPRFKLPSLKDFKVKVDERFNKKVLQKLNSNSSGKKTTIDRYGRTLEEKTVSLDKFYEDENAEESQESEDESEDESDEKTVSKKKESKKNVKFAEESEESEDEDDETAVVLDRARGEGYDSNDLDTTDESDSSSDSDSDSEAEADMFEEEGESDIEIEEQKPEEGDPSDTFAVVNMDWDNLSAVDLMATFVSFVPTGGSIRSVTIYPSEFGKEQMQKEEIEGPPKELFKSKKKKSEDSDSESDDDLDVNNPDDFARATRKLYEEEDGKEDYDSKALRRYQLQRLRYYYAVVKCDSVPTSKAIYDNCDGTEYEATANIFDLRYVPEGMDFDDNEPKEICTKVPSNYRPQSTFVTDALQHSKVKLTWDETPKERVQLSTRLFSQNEIDEMDFKAYLASDSEEEDDQVVSGDKYKNLLGGLSLGSKKNVTKEEDSEEDVDMEITFTPGLDESAKDEIKQEAEATEESTIEAYRRKEKERRKRRMEKFKQQENEDSNVTEEDSKKLKNKKDKKGKKNSKEDAKKKAELELIMMNEDDEGDSKAEHFNMKDVIKAEKAKNKKGRKNKSKNVDDEMVQDDFEVDLSDARFKQVFESHEYSIDPTSSEFKKTDTMKKIMKERSKRLHQDDSSRKSKKAKKSDSAGTSDNQLSSLVTKLKNRSRR